MTTITREIIRAGGGPAPANPDSRCLVLDDATRRLPVRHERQASRHSGCDEFEVAKFLKQSRAAQAALIDSLFLVPADAWAEAVRLGLPQGHTANITGLFTAPWARYAQEIARFGHGVINRFSTGYRPGCQPVIPVMTSQRGSAKRAR